VKDHRRNSHTVSRLTAHIVWVTKYRYPVLQGYIQKRCRALLIQVCGTEDVRILKGVASKDHVHMHIEYPPKLSLSNLVKRLKERGSRHLQDEFPELKKRYLGGVILGQLVLEFGRLEI
jgi:putative transposase